MKTDENQLMDLCLKMLELGAFADGTKHMRAPEITALLEPFFGRETIDKAVQIVCADRPPPMPK